MTKGKAQAFLIEKSTALSEDVLSENALLNAESEKVPSTALFLLSPLISLCLYLSIPVPLIERSNC